MQRLPHTNYLTSVGNICYIFIRGMHFVDSNKIFIFIFIFLQISQNYMFAGFACIYQLTPLLYNL